MRNMLDNEVTTFLINENITLFKEPENVIFKTRCSPNAAGLIVGYRGPRWAIIMGPEIRKVFLVTSEFLVEHGADLTYTRKFTLTWN